MDWLLSSMAIFIENPLLALAIGFVLVVVGRRARRRVVAAVGGVWLLYGLYEFGMRQRWLCSGECNIRIDLFLIYPVLALGLVAAGLGLVRTPRGERPPA